MSIDIYSLNTNCIIIVYCFWLLFFDDQKVDNKSTSKILIEILIIALMFSSTMIFLKRTLEIESISTTQNESKKMNIDIKQLQKLTREAIANQENERVTRILQVDDQAGRRAWSRIGKITDICEQAARRGESSATVQFCVEYARDNQVGCSLDFQNLQGASRAVWNFCIKKNINPKLIYAPAVGRGVDGFDMRVSWEARPEPIIEIKRSKIAGHNKKQIQTIMTRPMPPKGQG